MKRRPEVLLILIGLAIAIASLPYRSLFPFDDTFITFRYAANFANGHGLVWNIGGPHTEGFTNFLFVVLLSGCAYLHAPLLESSQAISILATIVTSVTLYRTIAHVTESVSERKVLWPSMLGALLYLSDPFVWYNAWSGMETSLFVMLIVLSIASLQKAAEDSNFRWSFVFAVAAALTRPEGALMVAIAILVLLLTCTDKKRTLTDALIWGVLPLVVYAIWKYLYFGDLLPNSFYVKALQPQSRLESHLHGLAGLKTFYLGILLLPILGYSALFLKPKTEKRLPRATLASLLWVALITGF